MNLRLDMDSTESEWRDTFSGINAVLLRKANKTELKSLIAELNPDQIVYILRCLIAILNLG